MDNADSKRGDEALKQLQIMVLGVLFALGLQQILEGASSYFPLTMGYQHFIDGALLVVVVAIWWARWARKW